jgi:Flp pilus assembly protein TadD
VFRYANFLSAQNRLPEAILIVRTARELDPKNEPLNDLLNQLLDQRNSKGGADAPHQENG